MSTLTAQDALAFGPTTYSSPGTYTYSIPSGTGQITFTVAGSAGQVSNGVQGGHGAVASGSFLVPSGTTSLTIDVGGYGSGGSYPGGTGGSGVDGGTAGGGGSAIEGYVVAGGGGGDGGADSTDCGPDFAGQGGFGATSNGGYGTNGSKNNCNGFAGAGAGGGNGNGGAGGSADSGGGSTGFSGSGTNGGNGASSSSGGGGGGGGGGGYGGGGGGGSGAQIDGGGGGGGGGSWAAPAVSNLSFATGTQTTGSVTVTPSSVSKPGSLSESASPTTQTVGGAVTLDVNAVFGQGTGPSVGDTITFNNNGSATPNPATCTLNSAGTCQSPPSVSDSVVETVDFTASDSNGNISSNSVAVTWVAAPPIPSATCVADGGSYLVNQPTAGGQVFVSYLQTSQVTDVCVSATSGSAHYGGVLVASSGSPVPGLPQLGSWGYSGGASPSPCTNWMVGPGGVPENIAYGTSSSQIMVCVQAASLLNDTVAVSLPTLPTVTWTPDSGTP